MPLTNFWDNTINHIDFIQMHDFMEMLNKCDEQEQWEQGLEDRTNHKHMGAELCTKTGDLPEFPP